MHIIDPAKYFGGVAGNRRLTGVDSKWEEQRRHRLGRLICGTSYEIATKQEFDHLTVIRQQLDTQEQYINKGAPHQKVEQRPDDQDDLTSTAIDKGGLHHAYLSPQGRIT